MIRKIIKFLKAAFPYIAALVLWRLSVTFWNPVGILALIPVFYYSFIKPMPWFGIFATLMCFLIDYNFDTVLFWTSLYCLLYAINGFQNFVDLTRQKFDGLFVFLGFIGLGFFIIALSGWRFVGFIQAIWLTLWMGALYIPFSILATRISDD